MPADLPAPWVGHMVEVASLPLFGWCWWDARRGGRGEHVELGVAVAYGIALELADMWIFGTYHYGTMTWWWVAHVPIYIPLLWAAILHSSMAISDRAGLPRWAAPFLDGLLAVLIDLAIDAIAIRLGMWSWKIRLDEGWFGVPAGNLCAWMWVAVWYSAVTRTVRERIARGEPRWHRALVPVVAYTGLFMSLMLVGSAGELLGLHSQDDRLALFAVHLIGFIAIVGSARRSGLSASPVAASLIANRWLMHASFFVLLVGTGVWRSVPALAGVSLGAMALEWWVQRWSEGEPVWSWPASLGGGRSPSAGPRAP
jgi:hypothetical protein